MPRHPDPVTVGVPTGAHLLRRLDAVASDLGMDRPEAIHTALLHWLEQEERKTAVRNRMLVVHEWQRAGGASPPTLCGFRYVSNNRLRHMLIGYTRVSKANGSQSLDLQRDALRDDGVDAGHVYHDVASGAGARVMTDSPTRVAAQRWHHWVPGAAVALMAAAATLLPGLAVAQDIYLRAGLDLSRPADTHFTDADCASLVPAALYGCGVGGDGAPLRSVGDFGPVAGVELGFGYAVAPAVRLEAILTYRPRFTFDGHANFLAPDREQSVSVDLSSLSGILAVYVDLPGVGVRPLGPLSPFVGGGLGAARVVSGETRMTFPKTRTLVPGTRRTGLTWRLTAGFGISWGERATLDLAWRYTDAGVIETGAGPGRVEWLDGSRDPVGLDLAPTQAPLRSHGLHLSLRYEL